MQITDVPCMLFRSGQRSGSTSSRLECRQLGVAPLSMSSARTPSAKSDGPETMRWLKRKSVRRTSARLLPRPCRSARKVTFWESGDPLHAHRQLHGGYLASETPSKAVWIPACRWAAAPSDGYVAKCRPSEVVRISGMDIRSCMMDVLS